MNIPGMTLNEVPIPRRKKPNLEVMAMRGVDGDAAETPERTRVAEGIDKGYLERQTIDTLARLMAVDPNSPEGLKRRKKLLAIDRKREELGIE